MDEARHKAARVRGNTQDKVKEITTRTRTGTQAGTTGIIEGARRRILAKKQAVQVSLCIDVGMLASTLTERVINEHLNDTTPSERVIGRSLDEFKTMEPVGELDASSTTETAR